METRLSGGIEPVAAPPPAGTGRAEAVEAVEVIKADGGQDSAPPENAGGASWPDDSAEAAFLAEARERGEPIVPAKAPEIAEETDARALPPLDTLVQRIPPEVRDTLDELFRAKFVRVQRVPRKALKS